MLYLLYSTARWCCLLHLIKQNYLLGTFTRDSNFDDSGISFIVFPSRNNLKLHISITHKMVKKVITNLDLSKGCWLYSSSGSKELKPKLAYILPELFNNHLKESCFPDCWKVSSLVPVFENVGERSTAKNYCAVSLLAVVSKVFEKLVNNRILELSDSCIW